MDLNHKSCSICDRRHISKPSTEWCSECNQALCTECREYHSLLGISENHMTIPISHYDELQTSILSISTMCDDHTETYELYCQTHDKLLCLTCIGDHSECKGIRSINKIAKNIKTSEYFDEVRMSLQDVDTNIDKMISEILSNQTSTKDCPGKILRQIFEIRENINKHLDMLEKRLKDELSELENEAENDMQMTIKSLEEKKIQNDRKRKQMDDITKYASDLQTFLGLRQLSSEVITDEAFLKSLLLEGSGDKVEMSIKVDENLTGFSNATNKFGLVELRKLPSSLRLKSQKGKQAQTTGNTKSIDKIVVKLVKTINTEGDLITGCDFLPDGNMVFSNFPSFGFDDFISVFESNGKLLKTIPVRPNYAFDVISLDNQTVAVTYPTDRESSIMFINIHSKKITAIKTEHKCYSATFNDDKVQSISPQHGIITIDAENGKILSKIQKDLPYSSSLTTFQSKLYFCNHKLNTIRRVIQSGL
ncbi:E3 ubiquitin-protein ligase TRIM39-like [Mytilus trossulus]|uniref:E3 ubiquitin-protein ligase TRIM39-like n=1 Tax=Mytilus trossulus TaxID=6551 RepID=UPI0030066464